MTYSCTFSVGEQAVETASFESAADLYQYLFRRKDQHDISITVTKAPDHGTPVVTYVGSLDEFLKR